MIDRVGLADFLRRRREALRPEDVGVLGGGRRRAVGLRRDEVAPQAGISSDYYAQLEQARGANPSEAVIAGLARALRLDVDQRDHLFRLAGHVPPVTGPARHVRPGLLQLVEHLHDVPTMICSDLGEVLFQNTLASATLGPLTGTPGSSSRHPGNLIWAWFTEPATRTMFPKEDWPLHSAAHVRDLRATSSRRNDGEVAAFITGLIATSPEFSRLWHQHDVKIRRFDQKRVVHPEVGLIDLNCEVILTPDSGISVVAFFPIQGTDARDKLELLRVIGVQPFSSRV